MFQNLDENLEFFLFYNIINSFFFNSMIIKQWKKKIMKFFLSRNQFHPLVFFTQIIYIQIFTATQQSFVLFGIGIALMLVFKINYFWYIGIIINPSLGYLAPVNLFIGLLSCDQMWKLIIYIFVLSDQILLSYGSVDIFFHLIGILGILMNMYKNLNFSNIQDNYVYFCGFSGIWIFEFIRFVEQILVLESQNLYIVNGIVTSFGIFTAFVLMDNRIRCLSNSNIQQIQSPYEFLHYIQELKKKIINPLQKIGIQRTHKLQCLNSDCFCKDKSEQLSFNHMYIRDVFLKGDKKFQNTHYENYIKEYYIEHLIQTQMFPLAVQQYIKVDKQQQTNIFKKIKKMNLQQKLLRELQKVQQNYDVKYVFENAFDYEKNYEKLKRDILELVQLKIKFWKEISKVVTKMYVLKQTGSSILAKLNKMHNFYNNAISPVEKQVKVYHGSIIYNLFLLVATNYKQYAQKNMKLIKKNTESITSQLKKNQKSFYIKVSANKQKFATIQNVTANFLKLIKTTLPKSYFIGKFMSFLIPKSYINQHLRGLRQLRRFNHNLLLGKNVSPIFFLNHYDQIVPCNVVVKYSIDIFNQLSIIGMVKELQNDSEYVLLNLDGECTNTTSGIIDLTLISTQQIQQKVKRFKDQWSALCSVGQTYFPLEPIKIQIRHNQISYTCILDSPLSTSFRYPNPPPIHLNIHNESQNYFIQNQEDGDLVGYLKKINHILDHVETDSQSSYTSRAYQIIDIIKKIQGISNFPLLKQFVIAMTIIFLLIFIFSSVYYGFFNITWIPPNQHQGNQYQLLLTLYEIELNTIKIINKGLSLKMIENNIFNNSIFSTIYGVSDYTSHAYVNVSNLCNQLEVRMSTDLVEQSIRMNQKFKNSLINKINIVTTFNNINYTQTTSLNSILRKSIGDCIQLAHKIPLNKTTLGQIYWKTIYNNLINLISLTKDALFESLHSNFMNNLILLILFQIIILLCWIPISYLNKKIEESDVYIYELITSVEIEFVNNEIKSLVDLEYNLKINSNVTNSKLNRDSNITKQLEFQRYSQQQLQQNQIKRKRNGQLDVNEKIQKKRYGYFNIFLSIIVIITQFCVKNSQFIFIENSLNNQIQIRQWRNQRLQLLINIKKHISNYQNYQTIQSLSNQEWIKSTFINRTQNYPTADIPFDFQLNCTNSVVCLKNSSFSTYLALDSFFQVTASKTFFSSNTSEQVILLELLEQICSSIVAHQYPNYQQDLNNNIFYFNQMLNFIFGCSLGFFILNQILIILAYKKLKEDYITLTRFVTLLSQQMIKKNKRVESFLQKLSKLQ